MSINDLHTKFRVEALHDHQRQAIEAAASGRDVLVIAPTGGGKSLGFWGAGLMRDGLTLVISPLRSLMVDQCRRLEELGIPVRIWNSDVKDVDKEKTVELLDGGWEGFIYSTPESLGNRMLSSALLGRIDMAVIDEAHCSLTERGFRINYAWLGKTLDRFSPKVLYACTATLPGADLEKLTRTLRLVDPEVIVVPVARGNLEINVVERSTWKLSEILHRHRGQPGIVFCATVAVANETHLRLVSQGYKAAIYHGRLSAKDKKQAQSDFMTGELPIAVATDAFILGIDKSDLRWIVHYDFPKSIQDWVQGFGRAGRDGLPAKVYGCFLAADRGRTSREFLIKSAYPLVSDLRLVWEYLLSAPFRDDTASEIGAQVLGNAGKYSGGACLTMLRRHRLADASPHPDDGRKRRYRGKGDFGAVDWSRYEGEKAQALGRFNDLCELAKMPVADIPVEIDNYLRPPHIGVPA